jgi:hypothetical protein
VDGFFTISLVTQAFRGDLSPSRSPRRVNPCELLLGATAHRLYVSVAWLFKVQAISRHTFPHIPLNILLTLVLQWVGEKISHQLFPCIFDPLSRLFFHLKRTHHGVLEILQKVENGADFRSKLSDAAAFHTWYVILDDNIPADVFMHELES